MGLKGVTPTRSDPLSYKSFGRSGWTSPEGGLGARIYEARIFDVNLVNWTVSVQTVFDQRFFLDIQVGSPYLHPFSGEGIYVVPEVGSKCVVAIPSDGPPPFVLSFVLPMERLTSVEDPSGEGKGFTFAGGRSRGKPGDIVARGRDGNFMILHRGGVAQFGAGPLAQRICVPLNNLVTDIDQNYQHFNGGGAIRWGVQDRGTQDPGAENILVQRVYANDDFADIRVWSGRVDRPVPADAGETSVRERLDIGKSEETVFEFALARRGFDGTTGKFQGALTSVKFKMFFDREGNGLLRTEGSLALRVKKNVDVSIEGNLDATIGGAASISAGSSLRLMGASRVDVGTNGGIVSLNGGSIPVAHVGSVVECVITVPLTMMAVVPPTPTPQPVTIVSGTFVGIVKSGKPNTLV